MSIIALIPARAGSKRIPGKNTKLLAGHPLIAYTIAAAKQSGVFAAIVVCSDDIVLMEDVIADQIKRESGPPYVTYWKRPTSRDDEADIEWVRPVMTDENHAHMGAFSILRPTSPFRTADTIQRAWKFFGESIYDSIRAVELARQHPAKMWELDSSVYGGLIYPIMAQPTDAVELHSRPTQTLPKIWVQNASLEMARTRVVEKGSIAGERVGPFFTEGYEGYDLNTIDDWEFAEYKIAKGDWTLPHVD